MNTLNAILSWGGYAVLIYGLKLVGDKNKIGFYVALVAEMMWIVWGLLTQSYALVAMSATIMVMYVRAIVEWDQQAKKTKEVSNVETLQSDNK